MKEGTEAHINVWLEKHVYFIYLNIIWGWKGTGTSVFTQQLGFKQVPCNLEKTTVPTGFREGGLGGAFLGQK